MAKYELVDKRTDKRVLSIDTDDLVISIYEIAANYREWNRWNDYIVVLSASPDLQLEYNVVDDKFYTYSTNFEKADEQSKLHQEMEKNGESIDGLYVAYLDQWEYKIFHKWQPINKKILSLIK